MLAGDHLQSASELGIPRGWHWVVISISEVLLLIVKEVLCHGFNDK